MNLKWDKPYIPDELFDFVPEFIQAQTSRESADENRNQLASILIFLPGIYEIGRMHTALTKFLKYVSLVIYHNLYFINIFFWKYNNYLLFTLAGSKQNWIGI